MNTATLEEVQVAEDYFGQEIRVGDLLVYPGRQSSNLWMNHIRVTKVEEIGAARFSRVMHKVTGQKDDGSIVTIVEIDRAVVVQRTLTKKDRGY